MSPAKPLPPRDTHGPTPLSQCGPVADLAARARDVDQLSQRIVPLLPTPLREHVGFAGLRNDRLLLLVESPAWATRARMDQARILAAVHSLGLAAGSVTAKVAPLPTPSGDSATPRSMSPRTAQSIRDAASAIADPDLRALFLELAAPAESPTAK
ncbi:MAG TPA: DciA family protein [Rhodanobacteraceae bacterium]|nr:DciA family protein [Rhodanobacteraceae bacterium]